KTRAPIVTSAGLLHDIPQSRLFDEMLKLLQTGHALASIEQLRLLGLSKGIYPLLDLAVERAAEPFVVQALKDTDRRVGEGKPVAPSFLLASLLWADVRDAWAKRLQPRGNARPPTPFAALQDAVDQVFDARIGDVSGRGKLGTDMREIWLMQPRFDKRVGSSPFSLVEQPRFRAGFDFMRLRAGIGEVPEELVHWWETFSLADDAHRRDMVEAVRAEAQRSHTKTQAPRKAKVHRVNDGSTPGEDHQMAAPEQDDPRFRPLDDDAPDVADDGNETGNPDAPARKRRRRRRKPSGARGGDGSSGGNGGEGGNAGGSAE
ncbi:MAG TPA: polynucleotide adenylyltransferase PcnB, partial [Burkholderiaceae bacterium]|nr:polynucleotide adenylyltransferase PcnB [Burkholderiaceae bacterium]